MGIGAVLVAAAVTGSPFSLGVNAGEVVPSGAVLWAHASPGAVRVEVARDGRFDGVVFSRAARTERAHDGTVRVKVTGLRPGTSYFYRFVRGHSASSVGRFSTAPRPTRAVNVRFAVSGDADATAAPGTSRPFYNLFEVYARMAAERNAFNINLGDTIYSDSDVARTAPALSVAAKWAKYRLNLSLPALQRLRSSTGLYSQWDDHEFINDFTPAENGAVYPAGVRAFTDYAPVTYTSKNGLYRSFRWGRNLELFFLDERSFRSAKASAGGTCDGSPGAPDLAPTAPAGVRAAFATLISPLKQPPPPGCVEQIRDPSRTMLGERQYAQFTAAIARSPATFKVIVNEVPIPGGPVDSGITEVVTGPVATRTFAKEIDAAVGTTTAGILISGLFFKPAPPRGVGMRCVSPDVDSYSEVSVTSSTLTVTPKDATGRIVTDIMGQPCTPVVIQAR